MVKNLIGKLLLLNVFPKYTTGCIEKKNCYSCREIKDTTRIQLYHWLLCHFPNSTSLQWRASSRFKTVHVLMEWWEHRVWHSDKEKDVRFNIRWWSPVSAFSDFKVSQQQWLHSVELKKKKVLCYITNQSRDPKRLCNWQVQNFRTAIFSKWLQYFPQKLLPGRHTHVCSLPLQHSCCANCFSALPEPHLHTQLCLVKTHKHVDDVKPRGGFVLLMDTPDQCTQSLQREKTEGEM